MDEENKIEPNQVAPQQNQKRPMFFILIVLVAIIAAIGGYFLSNDINGSFGGSTKLDSEVRRLIIESKDKIRQQNELIDDIGPISAKLDSAVKKLDAMSVNPDTFVKFKKNILDTLIKKFSKNNENGIGVSNDEHSFNIRIQEYFYQIKRNVDQEVGSVLTRVGFQCSNIFEKRSEEKIADQSNSYLRRICQTYYDVFRFSDPPYQSYMYDTNYVKEMFELFNNNSIIDRIQNFKNLLMASKFELSKLENSSRYLMGTEQEKIEGLEEELNKLSESGISRLLILFAVPLFGVFLIILMIIPKFYDNKETRKMIFEKGILLQLVTVFLLTSIILLLGIGNKLSSEVLGTLLGGISVYVLQQSSKAMGQQ